jgi:hypothetical protein
MASTAIGGVGVCLAAAGCLRFMPTATCAAERSQALQNCATAGFAGTALGIWVMVVLLNLIVRVEGGIFCKPLRRGQLFLMRTIGLHASHPCDRKNRKDGVPAIGQSFANLPV